MRKETGIYTGCTRSNCFNTGSSSRSSSRSSTGTDSTGSGSSGNKGSRHLYMERLGCHIPDKLEPAHL